MIYMLKEKLTYKKTCYMALKVVIDLPFEGSRKNGRWKRISQAGSRGEETITYITKEQKHVEIS